jgi:hypothetical protein
MIAGSDRHLFGILLRFDSPDDVFGRVHRLGAKAKPPVLQAVPAALL